MALTKPVRLAIGAVVLVVAVIAIALSAGRGSTQEPAQSAGSTKTSDYVIGRVVAKTGILSFLDNAALSGADLAVKQINAQGGASGHRITTFDLDNKSNPSLSGTLGQQAVARGVDAMAVSCDFDFGAGAATVAQAQGRLNYSVCASSLRFGPSGIGNLSFTAGSYVGVESAVIAEWAASQRWKSAFVLTNTTYNYCVVATKVFEDRWTALGGTIAGKDTYQAGDVSIATQIAKIKSSPVQPDVILLAGVQPDGASALKQIRAAGLTQPILTNQNFDGDFWKQAVPDISDVYFTSYASMYGDDPRPAVNQFFTDLKKETGQPAISGLPVVGYAFVQAIAEAIKATGSTDPVKIAKQLETGKTNTLLGDFKVDATIHTDLKRPEVIMQVQKGKTSLITLVAAQHVPTVPGS